jgi:hypothetical protein
MKAILIYIFVIYISALGNELIPPKPSAPELLFGWSEPTVIERNRSDGSCVVEFPDCKTSSYAEGIIWRWVDQRYNHYVKEQKSVTNTYKYKLGRSDVYGVILRIRADYDIVTEREGDDEYLRLQQMNNTNKTPLVYFKKVSEVGLPYVGRWEYVDKSGQKVAGNIPFAGTGEWWLHCDLTNDIRCLVYQTDSYEKSISMVDIHNGQPNGKWTSWFYDDAGMLDEVTCKEYKNGIVHGKSVLWARNGDVTISVYEYGRIVGKSQCWNSKGVSISSSSTNSCKGISVSP